MPNSIIDTLLRTHDDPALKIVYAIHAARGEPYFVGGCVRDVFLNRPYKDRDLLVTGLTVDQLVSELPGKVDQVGRSFGVLKVTLDGETIDVALPRTELSTGAGHRDFEIVTDPSLSVRDDLARRDFTMNAIAVHAIDGEIIDPFDGITDIRRRVLVGVGDVEQRFRDDPLRMLRGVRFDSTLGMHPSLGVQDATQRNAHLLPTVASERVYGEMCLLLMGSNAPHALRCMRATGMMEQVFPEWVPSVGFQQRNDHHHLTVDEHVLTALQHAVDADASLRCRWAVFLHDVAKPQTFTQDAHGHGHFYEHHDQGAVVAAEILRRLKAPEEMIRGVSKIVAEHLRPPKDASDRVLRRYVANMGELTEDGLLCRESDLAAHALEHSHPDLIQSFRDRIAGFKEISGFSASKLALRGDEIAQLWGLKGAAIGEMKDLLAHDVIDGLVPNDHDALILHLRKTKGE